MTTEYTALPVTIEAQDYGISLESQTLAVTLDAFTLGVSCETASIPIVLTLHNFAISLESELLLTVVEPPEIPDTTEPVIDNFNPPLGTEIARTDPIQFDVTDAEGLSAIFILIRYNDGTSECAWDNSSFQPRYLAGSSRIAITDGYRFTLRRAGGWLNTPIIIDIVAVDTSGNVASGEFA